MLRLIERPGTHALVRTPPSTHAIVSWNSDVPAGAIALIAHRAGGSPSAPLPYARWSPDERRSENGADGETRIEVDIVRSDVGLSAVEIASTVELDTIAVAIPPLPGARAPARNGAAELDVPPLSQYDAAYPDARGWCSAAALAMLLRYHGVSPTLPEVVRGVYDGAYGGTGNWVFNAAYAGARGLRGVVAYLAGIDHVAAFIEAGLPVAISIAWSAGQLTGAPLEHTGGHLLVVCGVDDSHVAVNDPAQPAIATRYPRSELDLVFRAHGGVAYLVAPRERTEELVALANGAE